MVQSRFERNPHNEMVRIIIARFWLSLLYVYKITNARIIDVLVQTFAYKSSLK